MTDRLKGKVAVVTGGASGFGAGIVDCFVREGASVLVADIDADAAARKACALSADGFSASHCVVDVASRSQTDAMLATCESRFGAVDILVANAGVGQSPCATEDDTDEAFDRIFGVNVKGVFHSCQSAIPHFRRRGAGNIVIMASGIALRPRPKLAAYGASKAAVVNFGKGLALELAPDRINVNILCPSLGDTPLLAEFVGETITDAVRARLTEQLPLGSLISAQDVGEAAVFLASTTEARNITGTTLAIDGGRCI